MRYQNWALGDFESVEIPGVSAALSRVLAERGILSRESLDAFLHPTYEKSLDPFLFAEMDKAVERLWDAVANGEMIAVYADYDADAVTAAAVVVHAFRYLGVDVKYYIPDRFTEGYGLNIEAFEKLKQDGARVVITVDCGTNSVDVAEWCLANEIDLIITDHHEVTGLLPKAFALINPKNPEEPFPDKQMTGAGVAFKLVQGLFFDDSRVEECRTFAGETHTKGWEKWLLDIAAIGTVADCHSLMGENRILVKFGLAVMHKTKWLGLRVLLQTLSLGEERKLDARAIGFQIAPRINAAGRLTHASVALDLFLAEDPKEAVRLASELEEINLRRQGLTERISLEAFEQASIQQDREVLVLSGEDWHQGVVGIVAGRVAEKFGKPAIVLSHIGGELTGSARTRGDFNVVECLQFASIHLSRFGGHMQAAGLTLLAEKLDDFTGAVLQYARDNQDAKKDYTPTLELSAELSASDLNIETCELLAAMEPFGVGNVEPKFLLPSARVVSIKNIGQEQTHAKLLLDISGIKLEAIGFGFAKELSWLDVGSVVDVAGTLGINEWNGMRKVDFKLIDVRPGL